MVRWYFCADKPRYLPYLFSTVFLPWEREDFEPLLIGPSSADTIYDRGANRGYDGQCIPDNGGWFLDGQPPGVTPGPVLCCTPAVQGAGGLGGGGSGYNFCLLTEDLDDIDVETPADLCLTVE